jgi:HlyD family secretion protein
MSGQVEAVYASYNDRVKKGQSLVLLNTDMLKVEELQSAAEVQKAQANYDLQLLDYQNKQKLAEKDLISAYDLASSKTSLAVYEASLASAKASYQVIETKLNQYALIKSPIDGIVLDKNVEPGESVVEGSSSNATTLFTLAEDLSSMEIEATVDELDISSVKVGQEVRFTVDSQPNESYSGTVKEIHLVPKTTNSVVNYYVIIKAPNKGNTLLPGMTATINFIVEKKDDVFVVPNSALRYTPTSLSSAEIAKKTFLARLPQDMTEDQRKEAEAKYDEAVAAADKAKADAASKKTQATGLAGMVMGGGGPGGPGGFGQNRRSSSSAKSSTQAAAQVERKALWYLDSANQLQCVLVEVGVSDGVNTEVSGAARLEGMKVILKEKAE